MYKNTTAGTVDNTTRYLLVMTMSTADECSIHRRRVRMPIFHFTVVCLVALPLSGSEARGDLALIQTFLVFIC